MRWGLAKAASRRRAWLIVGVVLIVAGSAGATTMLFTQVFPPVTASHLTQHCGSLTADNPVQAGGGGIVTYDCTTAMEFAGSPPPYIPPTVAVGTFPQADAVDSAKGEVFVTNYGDNTVSVLSDATNAVVATVPVGVQPAALVYDGAKGEVYVGNQGDGTVSVISDGTSAAANTVVATVAVGSVPIALVHDSGKGEIFVANGGDGTVSVISDATNLVAATVTVGSFPQALAYDSGLGEVFVANLGDNTVSVISDGTTAVAFSTVSIVSGGILAPGALAYDGGTGEIYVANGGLGTCTFDSTVSVITDHTTLTATANTVLTTVFTGWRPAALVYDSGVNEVFVANYGGATDCNGGGSIDGTVAVLSDGSSLTPYTVVATVTLGLSPNPVALAYDAGTGEVFVANSIANSVTVVSDATDLVLATIGVGTDPTGLAYDSGKGEVFVVIALSGTVTVVSDTILAGPPPITTTIPVDASPTGVAYDSGLGEVFVANFASNTVSVISDATNTVVATVLVGNAPYAVAYDSGTGEAYVVNNGDSTVSMICDGSVSCGGPSQQNMVVGTVSVGFFPLALAYDSGTGGVYVGSEGNSVSVICDGSNSCGGPTQQHVVVATVVVGAYPAGIAYDSADGKLFVADQNGGSVSVICDGSASCGGSLQQNMVVATVSLPGTSSPVGVAYDNGNGDVYVANEVLAGNVTVINAATNALVTTVALGTPQFSAVYDGGKGAVFVRSFGSSSVSVISDVTNELVATVPVGAPTGDLAYDAGTGEVFVANQGDNTVTVIPELQLYVPALNVNSLTTPYPTPTFTLPIGATDLYVYQVGGTMGATTSCAAFGGSSAMQLISDSPITFGALGTWDYCVDVSGTSVGPFSISWTQ